MDNLNLHNMSLRYYGNIAILSMTHEATLNAMSDVFITDFKAVLKHLNKNKENARALVITGKGKGFSVGADLKMLPSGNERDLEKTLREKFEPLIRGLKELPFPTIASVNGYAAGAGMGLMMACDITIAARSAVFIQAFVNIGLIPDMGCTYFLPRLIGRARASAMMMLGDNVSAEQAEEYGLIYKCVNDDQLEEVTMKVAGKLASGPTSAIVQIRELLDQSHDNTFEEQMIIEAKAQKKAGLSKNFEEGVKAFVEKRLPDFE